VAASLSRLTKGERLVIQEYSDRLLGQNAH
jgi:hypothetical protein